MGAQAEVETIGVDEVEVGTHTIFAGELVGADVIKEGEPMTYAITIRSNGAPRLRQPPAMLKRRRR